jgi:hypothetical protein
MRSHSLIAPAVLLMLFGAAAAPASAQQDRPGTEARPRQRESPRKPGTQQPKARPEERPRQPARNTEPRRRIEPGDQRGAWQEGRARDWQSEHRTWQQRGGYHGYRIPPARFRTYFGRDRWFRIHGAPMVFVGRYPRFKYGGYWFRLVDPWPEDWTDDWYERDDVSIDYYGDGYYLVNRHHPGIRIAVQVYFE